MSKLQAEIASTQVGIVTSGKSESDRQNVLVDSLLDSVSGGWVNAFMRWSKAM